MKINKASANNIYNDMSEDDQLIGNNDLALVNYKKALE